MLCFTLVFEPLHSRFLYSVSIQCSFMLCFFLLIKMGLFWDIRVDTSLMSQTHTFILHMPRHDSFGVKSGRVQGFGINDGRDQRFHCIWSKQFAIMIFDMVRIWISMTITLLYSWIQLVSTVYLAVNKY